MRLRSVLPRLAVAALIAGAALPATSVAAEAFPTRPIQVIIPFQPGDTDNMVRPFLDRMNETLGQSAVLVFKPGAGGGLGAGLVATSKPDGYTLVGTSQGSIVVVPLANKDIRYSTDAFTPVAALSEGGLMLVVASNAPWKTMKELVEYSRAAPEKVTYGSSGAMGITHLLAEIFAKEAGVRWIHVPMQGSAPAITALLGGHVTMASTAVAPALAHIKAGTLRPLAVFGDTRMKAFPDVPTLKELGYATASPVLYGILAPKGTPREVVNTIYAAAKAAVDKHGEQIAGRLAMIGAEIRLLGPDEYRAYLQGQAKLFAAGIKSLE